MDELHYVDPSALLYLVAELERIRSLPRTYVGGTYPKDGTDALQMLLEADFEGFIGTPKLIRSTRAPARCLEIKRGQADRELDAQVWMGLLEFMKTAGADLDAKGTDELYNAFGECISNVKNHAFSKASNTSTRRDWYAMAIGPFAGRPARAVVVDLGVGIPTTVRRTSLGRFKDTKSSIKSFLGLNRKFKDDWHAMKYASTGEWKSSEDQERGTGLSGLRTAVESSDFSALHIVSGKSTFSYTSAGENSACNFSRLSGTIVCLELTSTELS